MMTMIQFRPTLRVIGMPSSPTIAIHYIVESSALMARRMSSVANNSIETRLLDESCSHFWYTVCKYLIKLVSARFIVYLNLTIGRLVG